MSRRPLKAALYAFLLSGWFLFEACSHHGDVSKTTSTFYLVQPAEHFQGFNGHLNWYGRLRSGDLMRFLKDSGVQKIYLNAFSRTYETVDSLRRLQRIDTVLYPMDSASDKILDLLKQRKDFGKKVLLAGPVDLLSDVAKKLGAALPDSAEQQYNRVYVLHNDHGKAQLQSRVFGRPPMPVSDTLPAPEVTKSPDTAAIP